METKDIFYIIIGILFLLVILIVAVFSSITLIILICNWNTRCRSISNLLTINSCIAFLFFILMFSIQIPYLFQTNEQENDNIFSIFCRIRAFLFLFSCVAKVFSYLIQAISRYFITILYKYKNLLTYRINKLMIILSWILSLIISSSMFISPLSFQYESESRLCILTSKVFHTSFILMTIAFIIPVNIIIILYGSILWHTTHTNRIQPNNITKTNNQRNIKVFQNILLLLLIVIIGGTPFLLSIIINRITKTPWPWYSISIFFIILSAAVESLTIFFTNKEVKTIFSTKIHFRRTTEVRTFTVIPITQRLSNQIGTNKTRTNI